MKVFISFSSQDLKIVTDLANALKNKGADVWTYLVEMNPGDSLIDKINEGMSASDYLILVVSKNSLKSYWVKRELNAAMMLEAEKKIKIIPILLDNSDKDLPPLLKERIYADFRADFASGFQKLRNALGLAGMTDTVIHQTATSKRILDKNAYLEKDGMKVLKRGDKIHIDMPHQKQYAQITDDETEFRTKYFTAKWDNLRNKLKDLKIDWSQYHPVYSQEDVLEESEHRMNGLLFKKYICKFGAEFTLVFNSQGIFCGPNTNEHCYISIDVKTMEVAIRPAIPK